MKIRPYIKSDYASVLQMMQLLFPNYDTFEELERDVNFMLEKKSHECFVAEFEEGLGACIVVSIRTDYVEGASSSPTAYLEAIFVHENHRQTGIGKKLFAAAEIWAKENDCTEIGSDTWLSSETAQKVHLALGFEEEDRLVHYIKKLG